MSAVRSGSALPENQLSDFSIGFSDVAQRREQLLKLLAPAAGFGARARHRTVPCRPAVPLFDALACPSLYRAAVQYARRYDSLRIVVVGEVDPRGIHALRNEAADAAIEAVVPPEVLDYFVNVAGVRARACDLDQEAELATLAAGPLAGEPAAVVLPLVLERLADPRPLLRTLRQQLLADRRNRLFLAAVDRAAVREADFAGPPPDPTRVREWTHAELRALLLAGGFSIVREERIDGGMVTFELACQPAAYAAHLAALGLPPPDIRYLLVSTEHSACKTTGGIGSYCAQMERRHPGELGFLYMGTPADLTVDRASLRWLIASELLGPERQAALTQAEAVHEVLPIVLFFYPSIHTIEGPDYQGLCAIAMQARRAGLLPAHLRFITRCHGSQIYLERCFQSWGPTAVLPVTYLERVAIEEADVVSFLSAYLEQLYESQGYRMPPERRELVPYPFDFTNARIGSEYRRIDTLVFFGKRTMMKGFPLFVEALQRLVEGQGLGGIERVVIIGPRNDSTAQADAVLDQLRTRVTILERAGHNAEVLGWLRAEAARALVVMPYRGDNFPVSIPEAIACGCQILAARAGGIPEMLPDALHHELLHDLDAASLAAAIARAATLDPAQRGDLVRRSLDGIRGRLEASPLPERAVHVEVMTRSTIGVIVPVYRTKIGYLEDLALGLLQQSRPADRVVFVDDGSPADYSAELERWLKARSRLPWELVRHAQNRGLPAARNSGLAALDTDYVVNLDSDDVPRPDFLRRYVHYLDHDRDVAAVTSWLARFNDGDDFQRSDECLLIYRPLGSGLALALSENCLGHANSAFRRAALLDAGGWDDQDRSMWEDYALFVRLLSSGQRIGVVPQSEVLYRVHPQSMARTYPQFAAQQRVGRNLQGLPRFDALRLEGMVRTLRADLERKQALPADTSAGALMKEVHLSMKRLLGSSR